MSIPLSCVSLFLLAFLDAMNDSGAGPSRSQLPIHFDKHKGQSKLNIGLACPKPIDLLPLWFSPVGNHV